MIVKWQWDTADSPVGLPVNPEHSIISDLETAPPGAVPLSGAYLRGGLPNRRCSDSTIHGGECPVVWSVAALVSAAGHRRGRDDG
jgi:hypothetical protein